MHKTSLLLTALGPPLRAVVSLKIRSSNSSVGELLPERDLDCEEKGNSCHSEEDSESQN